MERNNIRAAIQTDDFQDLQDAWKESRFNDGRTDFYTFITTPSAEREAFIRSRQLSHGFLGTVVITKI